MPATPYTKNGTRYEQPACVTFTARYLSEWSRQLSAAEEVINAFEYKRQIKEKTDHTAVFAAVAGEGAAMLSE